MDQHHYHHQHCFSMNTEDGTNCSGVPVQSQSRKRHSSHSVNSSWNDAMQPQQQQQHSSLSQPCVFTGMSMSRNPLHVPVSATAAATITGDIVSNVAGVGGSSCGGMLDEEADADSMVAVFPPASKRRKRSRTTYQPSSSSKVGSSSGQQFLLHEFSNLTTLDDAAASPAAVHACRGAAAANAGAAGYDSSCAVGPDTCDHDDDYSSLEDDSASHSIIDDTSMCDRNHRADGGGGDVIDSMLLSDAEIERKQLERRVMLELVFGPERTAAVVAKSSTIKPAVAIAAMLAKRKEIPKITSQQRLLDFVEDPAERKIRELIRTSAKQSHDTAAAAVDSSSPRGGNNISSFPTRSSSAFVIDTNMMME